MEGYLVFINVEKDTLHIDQESKILSNGKEFDGKGASENAGGSYGGSGGGNLIYDYPYYVYGSPNQLFDKNNAEVNLEYAGSGGAVYTNNDGGGTIAIYAKTLKLEGSIQANGDPPVDYTTRNSISGGSGGYIYLNIIDQQKNEIFAKNASIQSNGGKGYGNSGSGSGGRIVISGITFEEEYMNYISASGGDLFDNRDKSLHLYGAAGTIYFEKSTTLIVNNHMQNYTGDGGESQITPISPDTKESISLIIATNNSTITIENKTDDSSVEFQDLQMSNGSCFVEPYKTLESKIQYRINGTNLTLNTSSRIHFGINTEKYILWLEGSFFVDQYSNIFYNTSIEIYANSNITFEEQLDFSTNQLSNNLNVNVKFSSNRSLFIGENVEIR